MARVRQARRCRAHRTDGEPCRAYAIVGSAVCRAHGGAAPQVRRAAALVELERRTWAAAVHAHDRWLREWRAWRIEQILVTAELTGIPPTTVTDADIVLSRYEHGRPSAPEPVLRYDRRRLNPLRR